MHLKFGTPLTNLSIAVKVSTVGLLGCATKSKALFVCSQLQFGLQGRPADAAETLVCYFGLVVIFTWTEEKTSVQVCHIWERREEKNFHRFLIWTPFKTSPFPSLRPWSLWVFLAPKTLQFRNKYQIFSWLCLHFVLWATLDFSHWYPNPTTKIQINTNHCQQLPCWFYSRANLACLDSDITGLPRCQWLQQITDYTNISFFCVWKNVSYYMWKKKETRRKLWYYIMI